MQSRNHQLSSIFYKFKFIMVHLLLNVNYVTALFIFLKFRLFNLNFFSSKQPIKEKQVVYF